MFKVINDPDYPQIATVLDAKVMAGILQAALPSLLKDIGDNVIETCEIKNKRHKPGKSFVLSYHLYLYNKQTGYKWGQVIGARLCKNGCGGRELQEELDKHKKNTGTDSTVVYLPQLEMMVWVFPHDRKLIHLAQMLDVNFLKNSLHKLLRQLDCTSDSFISEVRTEILHYLPERSCMVRYWLTINSPEDQRLVTKIIYGKNYRDDRGEEVYSVMCQLAKQLRKCAQPLGYETKYRMLWQSHLTGIPLEWNNLDGANTDVLVKTMAVCLAEFHNSKVNTQERYGFREIDEQLFDTIRAAEPQDKQFAVNLKHQISTLLTLRQGMRWEESELRPLHQDLHLGNFMIEENIASLIDLDSVCLGDPLIDVASLMTNFYRNGLHAGQTLEFIDRVAATFLAAYIESAAWKIDHFRLYWLIAAAYVHEVIRRIFRQRHEVGMKHLSAYLDLSKRHMDLISEGYENA